MRKEMGKDVCACVHTPDQDYAPEGSCRTCLPLRPDLCLFGQRCTHRGSCPSHSLFLANQRKHMMWKTHVRCSPHFKGGFFFVKLPVLTISVNIHSAGVSLPIIVCVCLVRVTVVRAVIAAVTHFIPVIIVLPGIVHEWAVVLLQKQKDEELLRDLGGTALIICCLRLSIQREGPTLDEKVLYLEALFQSNDGISVMQYRSFWTPPQHWNLWLWTQTGDKHLLSCWAPPHHIRNHEWWMHKSQKKDSHIQTSFTMLSGYFHWPYHQECYRCHRRHHKRLQFHPYRNLLAPS